MLLHDMTLFLSSHNTATLLKLTVTYVSLESAVLKREGLLLNNVTPGADTRHSLHSRVHCTPPIRSDLPHIGTGI